MTEHISINNYTTPAEMPKKSSVQSKRLNYVDMVKGIAVLWVVFYHLISPGIVKDVLNHVIDTVLIAFFSIPVIFTSLESSASVKISL